jgi:hypothetical protein
MRGRDSLTSLDGSDRGATAILVAVALVVLIGFAALAVDTGIGFNDRRQQTAAADVGALAALQFAKTSLTTTHPDCAGLTGKDKAACRGAEEAVAVVDGTLPGRYSDADWDICVDTNKPAEYSRPSAISDCISFTSDLRKARVAMPGTEVDTAFGKAIGFSTMSVSAFAEAGLEMDISGGVLPFALGPSGAGTSQACFFAQDTGSLDIDPCTASTQGNFGKLDVKWYGNDLYGADSPECSGQNAWRMAINIITGTDHPLEIESKSPGIVNDVTNCDNIANPADEVATWTGNAAGAIGDGLFYGVSPNPSYEGRLICKQGNEGYPVFDYDSNGNCQVVNNAHPGSVDDNPLWTYIDTGWNAGPCQYGTIGDRDEMEACLDWYRSSNQTNSLFTTDLVTSTRFGGVPKLDADPGNGSGNYLITDFTPVFLETIYLKCNANTCDTVFSPGESSTGACPSPLTPTSASCGWPGNGNKAVEAMTAFILTLDMLPDEMADKFPYQDGSIVYNLFR